MPISLVLFGTWVWLIANFEGIAFLKFQNNLDKIASPSICFIIVYLVLLHICLTISTIQSGHSVMLASTFGQTRSSVQKPDNSHLSDGPLILLSLLLLLMGNTTCYNDLQSLFVVQKNPWRTTTLTNDHPSHTTTFRVTDSGFCSYTNPSRATIRLIRPHQCDSVLLYNNVSHLAKTKIDINF